MNVYNQTGFRCAWVIGRVPPHRLSATFVVKGTFQLQPNAPAAPLPEADQEMLNGDVHADEDLGKRLVYSSDFALVKPRIDLLLKGTAHAPDGKPVAACRVTFGVGAWSKALAVVGNRTWQNNMLGSSMTDPEPFSQMPITYDRSYGGKGFADNPDGVGVQDTQKNGARIRPLPNIEWANNLISNPDVKVEPAGYGPLSPAWPFRFRKVGKYDKKWLENNWPWFPDNFDWSFFNAAPPDQQIDSIAGDEDLLCENLHPALSDYHSKLPGLRVRWFLFGDSNGSTEPTEVPLKLDTIFVDMDKETLILVWRGVAPIRTKKMKEVIDHMIVSEAIKDAPRPVRQYIDLRSTLKAVPGKAEPPPEPGAPAPLPPLDMSWTKEVEKDELEMKAELQGLLEELKKQDAQIGALLKEQGLLVSGPLLPVSGPKQPGDPYKEAIKSFQLLQSVDPALAKAMGPPDPADFAVPADDVPAADEEPADDEPWTRERCKAHAVNRGSFDNMDLAGLDLSSLDFSGLSFEGAILRGTILNGCDLRHCRFRGASLAGADLSGSRLAKAVLSSADLAGANLKKADLGGADLSEADLSGADLELAVAAGVSAGRAVFYQAVLKSCVFENADLSNADLDEARLDGARFNLARLAATSFQKSRGSGVIMTGADLSKAKLAEAELPGADFRGARANESVWNDARLDGANFTSCQLVRSNFDGASLVEAVFFRADLRNARLSDCKLMKADLKQINLFRGTFEASDLTGANLAGSNLFEVEFYEARLEGTETGGANLKGTKLA